MDAASLLDRHAPAWEGATRHPFLDAVRQGTLPPGIFAAWLVQDSLFVGDLLAFQARLLARAPRSARAILVGGLTALEAELTWFEEQAEDRGLDLQAARHPVTAAYQSFMAGLEHQGYAAAITSLWALERAYLEAWASAAPGHSDYRVFVEHWTVPAFASYVTGLQRAVDAALRSASDRDCREAEQAFLGVARLERDFWEMAWSGAGAGGAGGR